MEETCVWMADVGLSWDPTNWAGPEAHGGIFIARDVTVSLIGLSLEIWADHIAVQVGTSPIMFVLLV